MTVYITERTPRKDFTPAEKFGKLDFLFHRGVYPDNHHSRSEEMMKIASRILMGFESDKDYILPVGDPVSIATVFMVLGRDNSRVKVLKYDREAKLYYPVDVDLKDDINYDNFREEN